MQKHVDPENLALKTTTSESGEPSLMLKMPRYLHACCVIFGFYIGYGTRKCLRLALKLILLLYFLFAVFFLTVRYGILPQVTHYKADIERIASAKLGRPLKIGELAASWQGMNPQLQIKNLSIQDGAGREALVLPEIHTTLSWWSLLVFDVRFAQIELIAPQLKIQRDRSGTIEIAGFPLHVEPQAKVDERGIRWLLAQNEISIRRGQVTWDDQLRANPSLELRDVEFVLSNHWHQHQFSLRAEPPTRFAAPVDVRGHFQQSVFATSPLDLNSWSGLLYSDLKQADLPEIHRYFPFPIALEKGIGSVRSWIQLDNGLLTDLTADVRLFDVVGKFRKDLPVLDVASVSGRFLASERVVQHRKYLPNIFGQAGHSLSIVNFTMQTRSGLTLPATTLSESFVPGENGQGEKVELSAKTLDLESLAHFAEHLPIPLDQRQILIDFAPKGVLRDFVARWQGSYPEISSYSIKGQFQNLMMRPQAAQLARAKTAKLPAKAAVPAIPGFENLTGSIEANDKGGSFTLDSSNLFLQLPSYFVDPNMPFNRLQMRAQWQLQANDRLEFQVKQMEFDQDGASGSLSGVHTLSMRQTDLGELDLSGKLNGFDLKTITRYIPEQAPPQLRAWLSSALVDGKANEVTIRIKGSLDQFPFHHKDPTKENAESLKKMADSEFWVKGLIQDGHLNFLPGVLNKEGTASMWPSIEHIKGRFLFDRARMEIEADSGVTQGVAVSKVKAVIADLSEHNALLQIDGIASGSFQGMVNYVKASPVDEWIGNFLHETSATGNAQLALKLQLPLKTLLDSKVQGGLTINGVDTLLQADYPNLTAVTGRVDFNERGVTLNGLKGMMLGGAVTASGGSQKEGGIKIRLEGAVTAEGLAQHCSDCDLSRLLEKVSGSTHYLAQIGVKNRQTEFFLDSNLQGLASQLPAPLAKPANDAWPLHFEIMPEIGLESKEQMDRVSLSLGSMINAQYQRKKENEPNATWSIVRGAIGVDAPAILPDSGLAAHVNAKSFNLDEWRHLFDSTQHSGALRPSMEPHVSTDFKSYVLPNLISLQTDELQIFGKKIEKIVLGASKQRGAWQINLDAKQASGSVTWTGMDSKTDAGRISARLSRLIIPKSATSDVGDILEARNTPKQLPGIDLQVENFELLDKKLGQLELVASNGLASQGREWTIEKLLLKNEDADLHATGHWLTRGGESRESQTHLNYDLDVHNAGKFLDRFEFSDVLRGGKGKLEGELEWNGLPFLIDMPSLAGRVQLHLGSGQFLKVDPGGAKLLGVLSLQSLPRRFSLDFRDVFSEGFAFDHIVGEAQLKQGVAHTENLKMSSVNAAVLLEGSADLVKETQDLHVAVIPDINAGTASVVYGLVVNPVIGLGTFLAQLLFRDPMRRALTYEYQISGSWKNPSIAKIENKERQALLEKQKRENAKAKPDAKVDNKLEIK